jgi:extradiol dioxygenase family protein
MKPTFHLSIGVNSLEDSVNFFADILKASVSHRDPSGYVNIDLFGCQITLKQSLDGPPSQKDLHFGVNLGIDAFDQLAENILASGYRDIVMAPQIVDADTPLERKKMYVKCPTGYLIELKGYR